MLKASLFKEGKMLFGIHNQHMRQRDFEAFVKEIKQILNEYIGQKKRNQENGWQEQAQRYLDYSLLPVVETQSLFCLKISLEKFTEQLRSHYNRCATYFFSDQTLKSIGSYIGGQGSGLKEKLQAVLQRIEPLQARYVLDEIRVKDDMRRYDRFFAHVPLFVDPMTLLSEEGRLTLKQLLAMENGVAKFNTASAAYRLRHVLFYRDDQIIAAFQQTYPEELNQESADGPKP